MEDAIADMEKRHGTTFRPGFNPNIDHGKDWAPPPPPPSYIFSSLVLTRATNPTFLFFMAVSYNQEAVYWRHRPLAFYVLNKLSSWGGGKHEGMHSHGLDQNYRRATQIKRHPVHLPHLASPPSASCSHPIASMALTLNPACPPLYCDPLPSLPPSKPVVYLWLTGFVSFRTSQGIKYWYVAVMMIGASVLFSGWNRMEV